MILSLVIVGQLVAGYPVLLGVVYAPYIVVHFGHVIGEVSLVPCFLASFMWGCLFPWTVREELFFARDCKLS